MALKGNLRDFTPTQLFNLIHLAKKTGTLTVTSSHTAELCFREGKLVFGELEGQSSSLAQILFRAGKLTGDQARLIDAKLQGRGDKQLGHRLIQAKLVTQNDIIQSIRQHILDIVYKIFSWVEGSFRFESDRLPPASRITIPIDLELVIMEGSRRLQESARLLEELPDLEASLRFVDRPEKRLRNLNLTVEEWRIISFVNPKNTIRQIAKANKLTDFQVRRTVYGMLQAGIVELVTVRKEIPVPADAPRLSSNETKPKPEITKARRSVVNRLIDRIRNL